MRWMRLVVVEEEEEESGISKELGGETVVGRVEEEENYQSRTTVAREEIPVHQIIDLITSHVTLLGPKQSSEKI